LKKALIFLKKEFLEMLPPTIFFLVVFLIFAFIRGLIADEVGITVASSAGAVIGALVVGKSILIADATPLFHWFSKTKLIYNVIWRIFLYFIIVLFFQFAEELIPLISKNRSVSLAIENLFEEIKWTRFLVVHIILMMFMFFYTFTTATMEAIGRKEYFGIFFNPMKRDR
jgi:hypothetical protein